MKRVKTENLKGSELRWAFIESRKPYFEPERPFPGEVEARKQVALSFGDSLLVPFSDELRGVLR